MRTQEELDCLDRCIYKIGRYGSVGAVVGLGAALAFLTAMGRRQTISRFHYGALSFGSTVLGCTIGAVSTTRSCLNDIISLDPKCSLRKDLMTQVMEWNPSLADELLLKQQKQIASETNSAKN